MVDRQSHAPDSTEPEPLSLTAFAASLYHAERALPHQNLTRGFAQLAAVRLFRWSISRKLARVMTPGSLPLAIRP